MRKCLILDDFVILFFLIRFILDIIWLHCHRLTLVECYFISTILLLVTDLQIRPFFVCWMALLVWCWICFNIYAPYMKYEENWWVVMMHTIDVLFICFWARMSLTDFFRRLWRCVTNSYCGGLKSDGHPTHHLNAIFYGFCWIFSVIAIRDRFGEHWQMEYQGIKLYFGSLCRCIFLFFPERDISAKTTLRLK